MRKTNNPIIVLFVTVSVLAAPGLGAECVPCPQGSTEYDVTDPDYFGANPNDLVDDSPAIQCALDCAKASAGTVFIPAGEYRIESELHIGSKVTLRGEGMGLSILTAADFEIDTAGGSSILENESFGGLTPVNESIHLFDLTFKGVISGSDHDIDGVHFGDIKNFSVIRTEFINLTGNGLHLEGNAANGLVQSCLSAENGGLSSDPGFGHGFVFSGISGDPLHKLSVVGCQAEGNARNGFLIENSVAVSLSGCIATGTDGNDTQSGFEITASDSDPNTVTEAITLSGCVSTRNGWGFRIYAEGGTARDISFSGCIAEENSGDGFNALIPEDSGGIVENMTFGGCHSRANTKNGFHFRAENMGQFRKFSISGGTVIGNGEHGILIHGLSGDYPVTHGTINTAVIMNSGQSVADRDGIWIRNGQHITISGNVIGDDQDVPTQNYAVQSIAASNFVHLTANDVYGNGACKPFKLINPNNTQVHNPGDIDNCQ